MDLLHLEYIDNLLAIAHRSRSCEGSYRRTWFNPFQPHPDLTIRRPEGYPTPFCDAVSLIHHNQPWGILIQYHLHKFGTQLFRSGVQELDLPSRNSIQQIPTFPFVVTGQVVRHDPTLLQAMYLIQHQRDGRFDNQGPPTSSE